MVIPEAPQTTQLIPVFGGSQTIALILGNLGVGIYIFTNLDTGFFVFSLIVSYIISCLIFHIYYRSKKQQFPAK